jgi:putative FmdB family regulatory protein
MPIYEYQCKSCNERHEIIQKFSDTPLEHCPKCGAEMKKLISSPAIQFKGSGFYKTDYASSSSKGDSKSSDSKGESKGESKAETKSESKTETKSETKSAD